MNFRGVRDLNLSIIHNLHRIPRDIEIIVGIPRSGLLPATLLALYLNRPLTDVDGLIANRLIRSGSYRRPSGDLEQLDKPRKVLLIDDSINFGKQMRAAVANIQQAETRHTITTAAVYASRRGRHDVDMYFESCPTPRVFEWNVMHHNSMPRFCVDLDGVLCVDPTRHENDDGVHYRRFLQRAEPMFLPTRRIGYIVTCRLEKYRTMTEEWLAANGVQYDNLIMLDLPNKQARVKSGIHASFKAEAYLHSDTTLFIESSAKQARDIARLSGKPVLCMQGPELIGPTAVGRTIAAATAAKERPGITAERALRLVYGKIRRALARVWRPA